MTDNLNADSINERIKVLDNDFPTKTYFEIL